MTPSFLHPPLPSHFLASRLGAAGKTYVCGHRLTHLPLPRLVAHFRAPPTKPHEADQDEPNCAASLPLQQPCAACQLATAAGVEEAIAALQCGPEALVEHDIVQALSFSLLELYAASLPSTESESESESETEDGDSLNSKSNNSSPTPTPTHEWDWPYLWAEWAKAFESSRKRVHLPELTHNLETLLPRSHSHDLAPAFRPMAVEAYTQYKCWIETGCATDPGAANMRALEREARTVQAPRELEAYLCRVDGWARKKMFLNFRLEPFYDQKLVEE
ncbi:Uu.00g108460.m01.CDS01 [Anthostomella pinea]|uniref:Uu.00g108460.m01.CDS01 n=1 Tax=Anthostomella pinea TaxID=933095 RepID=A0AAI8VEG8_9PEZI|nr:Uu.00g108460.m01.CDS01 [Anthostomella pinea]